jgi:FkbM family methyltransferase
MMDRSKVNGVSATEMRLMRNLIFDLGLFDGSDTAFYLRKGFRVVAVEARHDLCEKARERFADEIRSGSLKILERAIWSEEGRRIPFHVRSGWSSLFRSSAERDGRASDTIEVVSTTMDQIFEDFGIPHYLKIDLEAAEQFVVDALHRCATKPAFVSVEDHTGEIAERLHTIGYDRFQMVNQGHLRLTRFPKPSREGNDVEPEFDGKCSGLFGYDLKPHRWVGIQRLREQMNFWNRLREKKVNPILAYGCHRFGKLTNRGWLIGRGWADIHATTEQTLNSSP